MMDRTMKRSLAPGTLPNQPKKPRLIKLDPRSSPLQYLNTIRPGLDFQVERTGGLPHEPKFFVTVVVDGTTYTGRGKSIKHGKQYAAVEALRVMLNEPGLEFIDDSPKGPVAPSSGTESQENKAEVPAVKTPSIIGKTPVQILNEIDPSADYRCVAEDSINLSRRFTMSVTVKGITYRAFGANKKQAKHAAARVALIAMGTPIEGNTDAIADGTLADLQNTVYQGPQGHGAQILADRIGTSVLYKFEQVMRNRPDKKPWKVLAGIVLTRPKYPDTDPEVLCMATGTKCLNGKNLAMGGSALFDCHGEILARRCFKLFCYQQLDMIADPNNDKSRVIFEPDLITGKLIVKSEYALHLFISTSPCGDGRIFAPNESACAELVDRNAGRTSRGVLRTKIEGGEGTIPLPATFSVQTWDGIMNGDQRLLTHSCSDKVLRWNVLGLQGALLSHFMHPIYLNSIVLGSMFHPVHMRRAVGGRLEGQFPDGVLPSAYRLNIPSLAKLNSVIGRTIQKSPNFAVTWLPGDECVEVIDASTGLQETNEISRLSKRHFFQRFMTHYRHWVPPENWDERLTYRAAKEIAFDYEFSKHAMFAAVEQMKMGRWVSKPEECSDFSLVVD